MEILQYSSLHLSSSQLTAPSASAEGCFSPPCPSACGTTQLGSSSPRSQAVLEGYPCSCSVHLHSFLKPFPMTALYCSYPLQTDLQRLHVPDAHQHQRLPELVLLLHTLTHPDQSSYSSSSKHPLPKLIHSSLSHPPHGIARLRGYPVRVTLLLHLPSL